MAQAKAASKSAGKTKAPAAEKKTAASKNVSEYQKINYNDQQYDTGYDTDYRTDYKNSLPDYLL